MSKFNLLEEFLGEGKRAHEFTPDEVKKAQKKVFNKLKRNLQTFMTRETVQGNVESELAKALKLRTFEITGRAPVPIDNAIVSLTNQLHDMVVKLRKKSGKSFSNINESR
jgi:hypothetical protein